MLFDNFLMFSFYYTTETLVSLMFNAKLIMLQLQPLVPVHQYDKLPSYFIFAGLVFVPLSEPYLHEYGVDWYNNSPRQLCELALRKLPRKAGEQLVILSQVLHLLLKQCIILCAVVLLLEYICGGNFEIKALKTQ